MSGLGAGPMLGGLGLLLLTLSCVVSATMLVTARFGQDLTAPERVLAAGVVGTTIILAVHIIPGALGILGRLSVPAASLAALGIVWSVVRRMPAPSVEVAAKPPPEISESLTVRLSALIVLGLVFGYVIKQLVHDLGTPPTGIDALAFHLPEVTDWLRTGSLWGIHQYVPQLANGNYPNNGDVLFLAVMLPFHSALLVRAAMVVPLGLTILALQRAGRELGAGAASSLLFAAMVCAVPAVIDPAVLETQTDTLMLFGFAAGGAFLLRHARSQRRRDLILAGLALGISFGTKWYAVACVPALILIWSLAQVPGLRRPGQLARATRQLTLLGGLVLALGGFWLLRNLVESADPFFPLRIAPLGLTIFPAPPDPLVDAASISIAHYLGSPHVLAVYILPAIRRLLGPDGLLILAGAALSVPLWVRERRAGGLAGPLVPLLALTAMVEGLIYLITPTTALGLPGQPTGTGANVRYLMPALVAAAPLGAWLCTRLRRAGGSLVAVGCVAATWPALSHAYGYSSAVAPLLAVGLAGLGLVIGFGVIGRPAAVARRFRRLRYPLPLAGGAAIVGVLLVALAVGPRSSYRSYAQDDATLAWILNHPPPGQRVGLTGLWSNGLEPIFPAQGPRMENQVIYVGPWVEHLLTRYRSPEPFVRALAAERIDVLEIGLGFPAPRGSVREEAWATAAGFRQVARSARFALFLRRA